MRSASDEQKGWNENSNALQNEKREELEWFIVEERARRMDLLEESLRLFEKQQRRRLLDEEELGGR